jgi:glycerophosphoryl diester phosphodiesterase
MGPQPHAVVRIAHAYGNNRPALKAALAADVDMIEVDMWYRGGDLFIHHERKVRWLPLLIDKKMATHKPGRLAMRIGNYYLRPDISTIRLEELLERTAGLKKLLLDVKGRYAGVPVEDYVNKLVGLIRKHRAESWVVMCGQTYDIFPRLREIAPEIEVLYSIEKPYQWERFQQLMDEGAHGTCISYRFLDEEKAKLLEERAVNVFCWTVDDPATAHNLVARGVDGIISNNLDLLASLPRA